MLSAAESDLVRRDTAIPGLALVLDPDAFLAALRRAAPAADPRTARITYVRYKPRTYCLVAYSVALAGGGLDVTARACRPKDLGRWVEGREPSLPGPLGPGRLVLAHCAVVLSVFPNDLRLPELPHLTEPGQRTHLLHELLPERPDLWQGALRCLRYRPQRRYVAEWLAANDTRVILKACTRKAYPRSKHNAGAFQSRGVLRVARALGCSDSRCVLAYEWLPGRLLAELWGAAQFGPESVIATGAALAALHEQRHGGLDDWTADAAAADLASVAEELGFMRPELARRAEALARRLEVHVLGATEAHCPVHGDFSANQVLVAEQEVGIIDLDWACYGDPAAELGNFLAQAERFALRGELSPGRVEMLREALLEGYTRATNRPPPRGIGLYTGVELFRRTRFPFRTREPDWLQRTESLLERAEALSKTL
jgi:hypothetical protein